jgi:DNA-binding CsgD family transcriptional regulator
MGVYLSTRKIAQLQAATAILLSPFSSENGDEWRRSLCAAIDSIVDSRGSMFGLALPGERLLIGKPDVVAAMEPFMPPSGWMRDSWLNALALGHTVIGWRDVYEPTLLKKTDFYNEVVRPNRLYAPLTLTASVRGSPLGAAVFHYFEDESEADAHADERRDLLQLLAPAFQAAVNAYVAIQRQRDAFISFGELSHVALALFDMRGDPVHQSRALEQLLALDPESSRLRAETARMAANLSAGISTKNPLAHLDHPIKSRVTTRSAAYGLSAISFGDAFGPRAIIGVMIEDLSPPRFDTQRLVSEYHLTKRELQTAALLRRRITAGEIASALGVSVNTARRHTEHVLSKLGVHSKREAAEKLNGNHA